MTGARPALLVVGRLKLAVPVPGLELVHEPRGHG